MLTLKDYAQRVSGIPAFCLEDISELPQDATKPKDLSAPTDSIYIIYTSGVSYARRDRLLGSDLPIMHRNDRQAEGC